jgi:hypothetical protein
MPRKQKKTQGEETETETVFVESRSVDLLEPITHDLLPYGTPPTRPPQRRTAIFTVHGMGQQTTFQTLADVAESLREARTPTRVRNVTMLGKDQAAVRLSRAELDLTDAAGKPSEVHIYEAYWAPLTEGAVNLRDVMLFLLHAGITNLKRLRMTRMMFGKSQDWPINLGTPISLFVTLLTIVSLMVINTIIGSVVALRFALKNPDWPTNGLLVDLSLPAAIVSVVALTLGIMILLASHVKRFSHRWQMVRPLTWIIWTEMGALIIALVGAAIAMSCAVIHHRSPDAPIVALRLLGSEALYKIATTSWMLVIVLVAIGAISALMKSATLSRSLLWVTTLVNVVLLGALIYRLTTGHPEGGTATPRPWWWVWIVLFGVSWFIRQFLVQYLGDVAAYVEPYRLDRFNALREQIKRCAFDTADAIYRASAPDGSPLYDRVVIMAHSLGSVVAYDVLNMLLRTDLPRGGAIGVVQRTRALITFGSPLDKLAFLFSQHHASPTHVALAATIQPLVQVPNWRPRWINIFSRNDIISGNLDYFDDGVQACVTNWQDPEASTPLAAHTEYWKNALLWKTVRMFL